MQLAVRITLSSASPEPLYTGGPFVDGVAQMDTANPPTSGWSADRLVSCGSFGETGDLATGGNYGQLSDCEMSISNHDKWFAAFQAAGAVLEGASVEIGEALSSVDMTTRWTGTIADANFQGGNVEIRVENILATRHQTIPARILTAQEFQGISSGIEGKAVPTIYGPVVGLTPPNIKSIKYMAGAYRVSELGKYDAELASVACISAGSRKFTAPYIVATGSAKSIPAPYFYRTVNENFGVESWYPIARNSAPLYVEITSGTGSGQTRKVAGTIMAVSELNTDFCVTYCATCRIEAAWDTIPDTTSTFRFYTVTIAEVLIVADEADVSRVYVIKSDEEFRIPAVQGTISGIVTSDVSGEFKNGESYVAVEYVAPKENYGVGKLTDKIATLSEDNWNVVTGVHLNALTSLNAYIADAFCRTKIYIDEFPSNNQDSRVVDLTFSFYLVDRTLSDVRVVAIGTLLDGTEDVILDGTTGINPSSVTSFNNYSPYFATGGEYGNFSAYTVTADLPRPIAAYESIRAALFIGATSEYTQLNHDRYGAYSAGSNKIRFAYRDDVDIYVLVGDKIRPYYSDVTSFNNSRFCVPGSNLNVGDSRDWRTITNTRLVMDGGDTVAWDVTLDSAFDIPSGSYDVSVLHNFSSAFYQQREAEAGFAFSYGDIPPDSEFLVDVVSGRTFSASWPSLPVGKAAGDPITLARDAALDMLYRDLGLGAAQVDFDSFQALPADPITSALVERIDSAQRLANLCQQFNWVVGHDSDGRETATAWLSRVGSTDYDYSIDTGDVVEGTLTGVAVSDVTDLVNCPNVKFDWTQADGFRQETNVVDITADPLTLNSGNYLRYLTGFGDFATSLDVYESMHASYTVSNRKNTGSFELPDVADASGVLWPLVGMDRFTWMASRKPLFVMTVPDTSEAAFPTVGRRARVRHKRCAPAWVYGTIVEWTHDPMAAETEIVVMIDPKPFTDTGAGLLIDTIDPSGSVPSYIDQTDGTSEQYIDTTSGDP